MFFFVITAECASGHELPQRFGMRALLNMEGVELDMGSHVSVSRIFFTIIN